MNKFVALISGGKDSFFTIQTLLDLNYSLEACIYIKSGDIDSYMYQTAGQEIIDAYQTVLDVPLYIFETDKIAINKDLIYKETNEDEVEIIFNALSSLKKRHDFKFVSSGAIKSTYQLERVKNVCQRLNLIPLSPLFNRNQTELFNLINNTLDAIFVKIASSELDPSIIGKKLSEIQHLNFDNKCGEGGEYETLVLDAPFFRKRLNILSYDISCHPEELHKEQKNVFLLTNPKFEILPK